MGGAKVKEPQIFLHGQIRAGRNNRIKKKLILELRNILVKKSNLDKTQVWVYIDELPASQMIEYGEILPKAGQENKWFNNLPIRLKKKLLALDKQT
jgi:phenylpyruvate tautomerase PptA (4-oxalocrotonate tautomerase family)